LTSTKKTSESAGGAEAERLALLAAVLEQVPFDGWSRAALQAGAESLGLAPAAVQRHFPGGPGDAIRLFSRQADQEMLAGLAALDLASMKIRERVAAAVRLRLDAVADHREAVRRGLAFFALPSNGPLGLSCLYRTVDAIWYGIGDRSTDYNFYSKRLLLSCVYSSTLMFWINDKSDGEEDTWAFLERRISEVLKIGGRFGKGVGRLLALPDKLFARGAKL